MDLTWYINLAGLKLVEISLPLWLVLALELCAITLLNYIFLKDTMCDLSYIYSCLLTQVCE